MYRFVLSCFLSLGVSCLGGLCVPRVVWAQEGRSELLRAEEEYRKGAAHFKVGEYERALLYFVRVYRVAPNPNLVYNMARSFEELGRLGEAADYYDEYLRLVPDAADRQQVELTVRTLRALAVSEGGAHRGGGEGGAPVVPPVVPAVSSGGARGLWGWSSVGAGVLLGAGGGWFAWRAASLDDEFRAVRSSSEALRVRDERSGAAGWADGLFVGGAVLAGVGVYLLVSSPSVEGASGGPSVAVSPSDVSFSWAF
jgi:tetratricopeptide (TPR) repeat protein